jgi:hypothetical protein
VALANVNHIFRMAFPDVHSLAERARSAAGERLSWRAATLLILALSLLSWGAVAVITALLLD